MKTNCPKCGVTWEGEEIPIQLLATGHYATLQDAEIAAAHYGWTPENKRKFNVHVIGIETPKYDGVSYWYCGACQTYFDRWTGEQVEIEVPNATS